MEQKKYLHGAEPLYLDGDNRGLLLLHGAGGGTSWDMKEFAYLARENGYSIWLPSLPGYGTEPSDLIDITINDWLTEAREGAKRLLENCKTVTVVGHSIGGVIALLLAAENRNITRVVTWSAPWRIRDTRLYLLPLLLRLPGVNRLIPARVHIKVPPYLIDMGWVGYSWLPSSLGSVILTALNELHASVTKVECPALIIQGMKDEVISANSASNIVKNIPCKEKEVWYIPDGSHALMQDSCKGALFQRTLEFIDKS